MTRRRRMVTRRIVRRRTETDERMTGGAVMKEELKIVKLGIRVTEEERRRVGVRTGMRTAHTLYLIVVTYITDINLITTCSLRMGKIVDKPVFEPFLHTDLAMTACGGPAPRAAPDRPVVLLLPPSRTLGGRSVPVKRASPRKGAGPKLPWPYVRVLYRHIVTARESMKRKTSPPPRGGGTNRPQLPRAPSVMAMAGRRGRPRLAACIPNVHTKLFVWIRNFIQEIYKAVNVYDGTILRDSLYTVNVCGGTDHAARTNTDSDGIDTTTDDHHRTRIRIFIIETIMQGAQSGRRHLARGGSSSRS